MNKTIEAFTRQQIKDGLAALHDENRKVFKLMYGTRGGKLNTEETEARDVNEVVDEMPADQLDWALTQVENSLAKAKRV